MFAAFTPRPQPDGRRRGAAAEPKPGVSKVRRGVGVARRNVICSLAGASLAALTSAQAAHAQTQAGAPAPTAVDEVVVTATGRAEARSRIAATMQVIEAGRIQESAAKSLTDLGAENAIGFLSEWTPAQTSINIRGGASDGQGRDYLGSILVLVNGRRAGTANLSKFSASDIARIEVVRGAASVIYGSQNIGGVVNIITKTGRTGPGLNLQAFAGSWGLAQGQASFGTTEGALDIYAGINIGERDDFYGGEGAGRQVNSAWRRLGVSFAAGYQLAPEHRIDFQVRSDGVYDAGFRGSGSNIFNVDDRFNNSADLSYTGELLDGRVRLFAQAFAVHDVDAFHWASPVVRLANGQPGPGASVDNNTRKQNVTGVRVRPQFEPWAGNNLLVGYDRERATLRSTRFRAGVAGQPALAQIAPQDNNQTETIDAVYFEDAQSFFGDRLTVRGGVRQTWGDTSFDPTPNLPLQVAGAGRTYQALTYSTGATYKLTPWAVARVGASSGFRAPSATQLGADFTALGGGRVFGNPNLRPETSEQVEFGLAASRPGWSVDAALFRNVISDRVFTQLRPGAVNTSDFANNPADLFIQGLELQGNVEPLRLLGRQPVGWSWAVFGSGYYNFDMKDEGVPRTNPTAATFNIQRMYRYEASLGSRLNHAGTGLSDWWVEAVGIYRGSVWYDTEEALLIPFAEPNMTFIHRKDPFWQLNVRGSVGLPRGLRLYGAVNNLFDVNEHPIFIANDKDPRLADPRFQNGFPLGTSMPGRNFEVRLQARF